MGLGTSILGKHQQKRPENEQSRENGRNPQQHCHARPCVQDARPCASHHGPWWAPRSARGGHCSVRSVRSCSAAFWALLMLRFGLRIVPLLGHFGPPLLSSLIHMALKVTLSPITWLESYNSASNTQTNQNQA